MTKFMDNLARLSQALTVVTLVGMVIVTFLQVIFRYVLQNSLEWSEEGARYLFVWTCYLSMSYAMHSGSHLEVTVLRNLVSKKCKRFLGAFSMAVSAVFCLICFFYSVDAVMKLHSTGQTTTALQLSTYLVWLCLPIGFSLTFLQAAWRSWRLLTGAVVTDEELAI